MISSLGFIDWKHTYVTDKHFSKLRLYWILISIIGIVFIVSYHFIKVVFLSNSSASPKHDDSQNYKMHMIRYLYQRPVAGKTQIYFRFYCPKSPNYQLDYVFLEVDG